METRKSKKPPTERVLSTKMFHEAKGDEVRSRIVARECANGVFAPEHHAGTPPTWALKLVISRKMSKGRTRQLASHDVSVAFIHAWLERGVWVKSKKDLRLSDDWLWYVVKALYGMRESSNPFPEVVRDLYTTYEWTLLQTVPCLAYSGRLDSLAGWHGDGRGRRDDSGIVQGESVLPRLGPGASTEGTILRRILRWSTVVSTWRWTRSMWKIWLVSSRSKVRNRVRHQAPVLLVVDSAMRWSH